MPKHFIPILLAIFISTHCFGQKMGDYYISISSDSTLNCRLKFLTDTTIELSNVPQHMSGRLTKVFIFETTDTTIEISPRFLTDKDSLDLIAFGLNYFLKPIIKLSKIDGGFIDQDKALIYVRQKDFSDNPDMAVIIDGKTFIQDSGVTDGYGIIKKSPKANRALQKKLKGINKDDFKIEIVKGLEAYKRFGIKRVYGVMVITTKNNR